MANPQVSRVTSSAPASSVAAQYINGTTTSSSGDPLSLLFRAVSHAKSSAFSAVSRVVGLKIFSLNLVYGGSRVALDGEALATAATHPAGDMAGQGVAEAVAQEGTFRMADFFQAIRRFSGFFSYMTSRWSLACFTVALMLNRITIYASTRRHLNLSWERRLALRIIPVVLFLSQIVVLLRTIRCQTSPEYPRIRYGKPGKRLIFDYSGGGGFLQSMSSMLLPWESLEQSCSAVHMVQPTGASDIVYGSFAFLWPVFLRLCLSQVVETLLCALQGRAVVTESGMSLFEHSLAFAEAESMISQSIGLGMFGLSKQSHSGDNSTVSADSSSSPLYTLTRAQILERMNVTPELLLIALLSCCNSLTSNVLDIFGQQSRFRLLNTTIWGLCFMIAIVWGLLDGSPFGSETGVFKFPTVCIVGFIPHLIILLGILTCILIYFVALLITAFSLPVNDSRPLSLWEVFVLAHDNMQGSNQIRNIRFNRHDDFYNAILKIGYTALTAARESVFLNEGKRVVARRMTWLEEDRLVELEAIRRRKPSRESRTVPTLDGPFDEESVDFNLPEVSPQWESGYSCERKFEKSASGTQSARARNDSAGVGAFRGAHRYYHGFSFIRGILLLLLRWIFHGFGKILDKIGIATRPRWLKTSASRTNARRGGRRPAETLDFWILTKDGELELPENNEFDVEKEMRKRERSHTDHWDEAAEDRLDEKLYSWFKVGGSWGNQDQSPDYEPSNDDPDDTTSVITSTTDSDWEKYESEQDGRRTPTSADPLPNENSREITPSGENLYDISALARLLDPRDAESREEARILAAHLLADKNEDRILTRAQYLKKREQEKAQVLLASRFHRDFVATSGKERSKPSPEEESEILERLIISQRSAAEASASETSSEQRTWASGASGLGPAGPPCVVCQTEPRSIITWPCRCLCVCEECRVSLAMNNFGSCVTCRQEVSGFVRLWVP